jgi:hypothetical protein
LVGEYKGLKISNPLFPYYLEFEPNLGWMDLVPSFLKEIMEIVNLETASHRVWGWEEVWHFMWYHLCSVLLVDQTMYTYVSKCRNGKIILKRKKCFTSLLENNLESRISRRT